MKIEIRWNDGFKRDFKPIQHQFGSDYLWMKFDDGKEEWIPTRQVRNIKVTVDNPNKIAKEIS